MHLHPPPVALAVSLTVPVGHMFVHFPGKVVPNAVSMMYPVAQAAQLVEVVEQPLQLALQLEHFKVLVVASAN